MGIKPGTPWLVDQWVVDNQKSSNNELITINSSWFCSILFNSLSPLPTLELNKRGISRRFLAWYLLLSVLSGIGWGGYVSCGGAWIRRGTYMVITIFYILTHPKPTILLPRSPIQCLLWPNPHLVQPEPLSLDNRKPAENFPLNQLSTCVVCRLTVHR